MAMVVERRSEPLVELRQNFTGCTCIGVTINFSPKHKVPVKVSIGSRPYRTQIMSWGTLTPDQQISFFKRFIREVYVGLCHELYHSYELTAAGEVHCHAMLVLNDQERYNDYNLAMVRKSVEQSGLLSRIRKNQRSSLSNYIHLVDPMKWVPYMNKENATKPEHFLLRKFPTVLNIEALQAPKPE